MRRFFMVGTIVGGLLLTAAPVLGAPAGGCPTDAGYIVQDASAFPATQAVDDKGNQDGWVCVLILPNADGAARHFVIIDDTIPQ
jgi:hypothetical protein